jgi:nitrate reductase gamma subunit
VLVLIEAQLLLGIATTFWTIRHLEGTEMVLFMGWANGLLTFNPAAADLIVDVALVYKLHIVLGLTLFLITPFTRLVHIWSAPIWFLLRPGYQIVRSRSPLKRPAYSPTHGPAGVAPSYGGDTVLRQQSQSGQTSCAGGSMSSTWMRCRPRRCRAPAPAAAAAVGPTRPCACPRRRASARSG